MKRQAVALLLILQAAAITNRGRALAAQTEDVRYQSGAITLAALLMQPPSVRPAPAAVIIQGSGASDRSNQWARDISAELLRNGLAVLLTDKRGSGASGGDWRTAGFSDLADDVLAGVEFLRTRPGIDSQRIGIVGFSQGGHVAPLAAARSGRIAFVINVSGKAVGFAEGSFVEMANTARQAGLPEPDVHEVIRLNLAAARYLTTGNWEQYQAARDHALTTGARTIAQGFPPSADEPIWTFLRAAATYDPLAYWVQVTQPVLVVYGEDDERDNVPVLESVRRLEHAFRRVNKANHRILVVPGTGHSVRDAQTARLAQPFVDALAVWLREHVGRGGTRSPPGTRSRGDAPEQRGSLGAVTFSRLSPDVAVLQDSAYASNMTVIRTSAGLIVVDNFMHRTSTRLALAVAADSLGERRIALAINTHGHDDHTWGNQVVAAGVAPPPILAHQATVAYMKARVWQMREFFSRGPGIAKAAEDTLALGVRLSDSARGHLSSRAARIRHNLASHADLVVTPPTVGLSTDTALSIGRTQVIIRSIGAAHSAGDVAVVVADAGVIAVGDLAQVGELPALDATSGNLSGWITALLALGSEASRFRKARVVPGHGPVGDSGMLRATAVYLRALRDSVSAALAAGLDLAATQARLPLGVFVPGRAEAERHRRNVEAAWLLLRQRLPS